MPAAGVSARSAKRLGGAAFVFPLAVLLFVPATWPRWALMWLLAAAIYWACKILTWSVADRTGVSRGRQWAYLVGWPGMNAARFFATQEAGRPPAPSAPEWIAALGMMLLGGIVFWNAQRWIGTDWPIVLGWAGMIGTILMLHFGSFQLLSCAWRAAGIDAPPLMNQPLRSTSVVEFWSRRWNTAFRDLTHQFVFRPLSYRLGPKWAILLGFFLSGIVHDLVISVPAEGGYGGPTCFFTLQAVAILAERSRLGRWMGLGRGWRGWLFTAMALLLPARLLFHDRFVTVIVVPFMTALGAA